MGTRYDVTKCTCYIFVLDGKNHLDRTEILTRQVVTGNVASISLKQRGRIKKKKKWFHETVSTVTNRDLYGGKGP